MIRPERRLPPAAPFRRPGAGSLRTARRARDPRPSIREAPPGSPAVFRRAGIVWIVNASRDARSTSCHVRASKRRPTRSPVRCRRWRGSAENVLQEVVDALPARAHAPLDGRGLRVLLRNHARDDLAEDPSRLVRRFGRQQDVDVQASARVFGTPVAPSASRLVANPPRHLPSTRSNAVPPAGRGPAA